MQVTFPDNWLAATSAGCTRGARSCPIRSSALCGRCSPGVVRFCALLLRLEGENAGGGQPVARQGQHVESGTSSCVFFFSAASWTTATATRSGQTNRFHAETRSCGFLHHRATGPRTPDMEIGAYCATSHRLPQPRPLAACSHRVTSEIVFRWREDYVFFVAVTRQKKVSR